jgi:pre-mRNA-splicing factor ISY1
VSADEETARSDLYQMFQNQGPDYYGDFDELNSNLLEAEREAEIKGSSSSPSSIRRPTWSFRADPPRILVLDWDAAYARITEVLSLPSTSTPIPFPLASAPAQPISSTLAPSATTASSKRPANDDETEETSMTVDEPTPASPSSKKAKLTSTSAAEETASTNAPPAQSFQALSVLKQEDLQPPTLPTKEEMEKLLLERRKAALLAEYANWEVVWTAKSKDGASGVLSRVPREIGEGYLYECCSESSVW